MNTEHDDACGDEGESFFKGRGAWGAVCRTRSLAVDWSRRGWASWTSKKTCQNCAVGSVIPSAWAVADTPGCVGVHSASIYRCEQ